MSRDPLAVLDRLRRLQVDQARQAMGAAQGALLEAEARRDAAAAALPAEAAGAPGDFAAWLPAALARRAAVEAARRRADLRAEVAREALAGARAAARAVERLRELRADAAALRLDRAAQAALDEAGARRRGV